MEPGRGDRSPKRNEEINGNGADLDRGWMSNSNQAQEHQHMSGRGACNIYERARQ